MLAVFDDTPGSALKSKFWSLHCLHLGLDPRCLKAKILGAIVFAKLSSLRCMNMGADGVAGVSARRLMLCFQKICTSSSTV
jgi:hypothetical protein